MTVTEEGNFNEVCKKKKRREKQGKIYKSREK